jgi:O-antigen ligase
MYLPFCVYVFLVIVRPHEWVPALAGMPILPIALLMAFAMWLFRPDKTLTTPQHLMVPAFVAAAIFSRVAMGWLSGAIYAAQDLVPALMFFVVGASLAEKTDDLERVLKTLCASTFVLALHGLDQVFTDGVGWTGQALTSSSGSPRIQYVGVFSDPNDLAMLFVACVPLCVHFARHASASTRLVWLMGSGLLMYSVYLTNSRGGLVALLGVLLLFGALRLGKVATITLATLALPTLIAATRLTGGLDTDEESTAGRIDAWYTGLQLFEQNPLFGVGYGLFTDHNDLTAHNSWVLVLAETGFTGYLPWFTATTISLLMLWKMRVAAPPSGDGALLETAARDRALAGTLFWSTFGMLIAAFFLSRSYNQLFFLLWAWSAGHGAGFAKRDPSFRSIDLRSQIWRWLMLAVASIAAFYILVRILLVFL